MFYSPKIYHYLSTIRLLLPVTTLSPDGVVFEGGVPELRNEI